MFVDVAVVGAGIAGLSAAYELSRRDVSLVVLERSPRPGGVILSEQVGGFTIDGGPDALLIQKPAAIALCQEIGLGDRLVATKPPRVAFIQRGGRLHPLPAASVLGIPTRVGPFLQSRLFTWRGKLRMGAELFVPKREDDSDESIGSFMTRRFGREATDYLAEPLLAGIHAGDVDRLSAKALFPRFVDAERRHGSVLRALRHAAATAPPSVDGAFKSLPGGLSEMVQALVARIGEAQVCTNTDVARIARPSSADPSAPFHIDLSSGNRIDAKAVIVATPAYVTERLLRETDAELARLCGEVRYASAATVVLAFRRDAVAHPLNGSGFVVPRVEASPILAASWLSSKWPHRAPDDRVLMRAFFGGTRDPGALERSDQELVALSLSALTPLLGIAGEPQLTRVYRWERANAQHDVGHLQRVAAIDRRLADHPGLFLTGSGFRGVGIPDCVTDARATARAVLERLSR
jgi:protoporphyrinogen/coproporphyrinogen III oxidase